METLAEQFRLNYIEEGIEIGKKIGREEGRVEGREEGRVEGREEGRVEGMVEIVRRLMSRGFTQDEALDIACPDDYRYKVVSRLNGSERFLQ